MPEGEQALPIEMPLEAVASGARSFGELTEIPRPEGLMQNACRA